MPPPDDCPVEPAFDPFSDEYQADPYQVLAQVRSGGEPVFYAPSLDYYVVTTTSSGCSWTPRRSRPRRRTR